MRIKKKSIYFNFFGERERERERMGCFAFSKGEIPNI